MDNLPVRQHEIIICGGSLAGLATAIKLKQLGHHPCVIEKSVFPREKLCGEFLGPDALKALDELGLLETIEGEAYGPVTDAYFYNTGGSSFKIRMGMIDKNFPYALAIPRYKLDFLLQRYALGIGVEILEGLRVLPDIQQEKNGFTIHTQGSESAAYHSKIIIDATGRYGGLALQSATGQKRYEKTMGLQCHIRLSLPHSALHMFLFPGGYGGLQPISKDTANLCLLFSKSGHKFDSDDRFQTMLRLMTQNPQARQLLKDAEAVSQVNATGGLNKQILHTGILQIGDARLTVEPLTGTGMAQALDTGLLAAKTVSQALQEQADYSEILKRYEHEYRSKYLHRLQMLNWFRPFLFSRALQRWGWPIVKASSSLLAPVIR